MGVSGDTNTDQRAAPERGIADAAWARDVLERYGTPVDQAFLDRKAKRGQSYWARSKSEKWGKSAEILAIKEKLKAQFGLSLLEDARTALQGGSQPKLLDCEVKQRNESDAWMVPLRILPRHEVLARLVQDAEDDVQKVRNAQQNTKQVVATVTGSLAYHYKCIVEQFEDEDRNVNKKELAAYLDQLKVAKDGRDRHIFARVARLAKTRINASLRNKIADIVAGACLLGIRADDLTARCKQGFMLGPDKKISSGPSALGKAYREHEAALIAEQARSGNHAEASVGGQDGSAINPAVNWPETIRVLNDAVTSGQVLLHFLGRSGRMVKIGRVEHGKKGPVFIGV